MTKTVPCPFCGKDFNNGLTQHLKKTHHLSLEEAKILSVKTRYDFLFNDLDKIKELYYNDAVSMDELRKMYDVDTSIMLMFFVINGLDKRSGKESHNTIKYKEKYKDCILKKYGVDNVSKINGVSRKKQETMYKNYGYINQFSNKEIHKKALSLAKKKTQSIEYREEYKKILLLKYGVDNIAKIEDVAKKISISQKNRFEKMSTDDKFLSTLSARMSLHSKGPTSKLETHISEVLDDLFIIYKRNSFIANKFVDFLIEGQKIIIEAQGDYWHANPVKYKSTDILHFPNKHLSAYDIWENDRKRKELLEQHGYKVYFIWENDIRNGKGYDKEKTLSIIVDIIGKEI